GDILRVIGVATQPAALFEALRTAREGAAAHPAGLRTWGAYQHYGNPFTRFFPRNLPRLGGGDLTAQNVQLAQAAARARPFGLTSAPDGAGGRFAKVKQVIAGRYHELMRLPGVAGVRPGFKYENDWSTGQEAIIVSVRELKGPQQPQVSEQIPTEVEG